MYVVCVCLCLCRHGRVCCPFGPAQVIVKKNQVKCIVVTMNSRRLLPSSWCTVLGVPCCRLSSLCAIVTFLPVPGDQGLDKCYALWLRLDLDN